MMRNFNSLVIFTCFTFALVACKPAQEPAEPVAANDELSIAYRQVALSEVATGEQMKAACDAGIAAFQDGISSLENVNPPATVENFLEPLNATFINALNVSLAASTMFCGR